MKIALWFHCRISGGAHPTSRHGPATPEINKEHALSVVTEQMNQIHQCGLSDAASRFVVCVNGTNDDYRTMRRLSGAEVISHGQDAAGELPTLGLLDNWVRKNPDYFVIYAHSKGVCWPGDGFRQSWRRCLMRHVIKNWGGCCDALAAGHQMAGAHWLTRNEYPQHPEALQHGIWGGNFWAARGDYLSKLKPVQANRSWDDKYDAEMWAVSGAPKPVKDFAHHWPNIADCSRA